MLSHRQVSVLLLVGILVPVAGFAGQRWLPLTAGAIIESIREGGMTDDEAIARIAEAGVAFRMNEDVEEQLRRAGISDRVIAAAGANLQTSGSRNRADSSLLRGTPLSESDILRALRKGVSPDEIASAVDRQGVSFHLDPMTADRLELAGGDLALIGMITMRQPLEALACDPAGVEETRTSARLVRTAPLKYPRAARMAHIEGKVSVRAVIVPDGTVAHAYATEGNPLLARAAEESVRLWRYEPARKGGSAVTSIVDAEVRFLLAE